MFGCPRQMDASYDHPTPLEVKHRIRSYLLGKETSITGRKCNSLKELDSSNISEGMFRNENSCENSDSNETELQRELTISAMVFASIEEEKMLEENSENFDTEFQERTLETAADEEGLRYVGGFLASKFPEYQFLGCKLKKVHGTWISEVERDKDKLTSPSAEFFEKLKIMEKLFKLYHGEKLLRPGKGVIRFLANHIENCVSLPSKVVLFFVRCRMFFRMRVLNTQSVSCRQKIKRCVN